MVHCHPAFCFFVPFKHREVHHPGEGQHVFIGQLEPVAEPQAQRAQRFVCDSGLVGHELTHGNLDGAIGKHLRSLPNVVILEDYQVTEVKGDEFARSVVIHKNGDEREIAADVIFVELGLRGAQAEGSVDPDLPVRSLALMVLFWLPRLGPAVVIDAGLLAALTVGWGRVEKLI